MRRIGIMQGRLGPPEESRFQSFPRESWAKEFARAAEAGLDCIEWIYDRYGADVNPIAADDGIARMKALSAGSGIAVASLCADYFMDWPLVRAEGRELEARFEKLTWLIGRCRMVSEACGQRTGEFCMVLPFVDASEIRTDAEMEMVIAVLQRALPAAEKANVMIALETSLDPSRFSRLLDRLPHRLIKVNYDSGNSAALGFRPQVEFAAYGQRIGSVHIKDRIRGGGTVPLGTGSTDFSALFTALRDVGYAGDFILQVARGAAGDEVNLARRNRACVEARLAIGAPNGDLS